MLFILIIKVSTVYTCLEFMSIFYCYCCFIMWFLIPYSRYKIQINSVLTRCVSCSSRALICCHSGRTRLAAQTLPSVTAASPVLTTEYALTSGHLFFVLAAGYCQTPLLLTDEITILTAQPLTDTFSAGWEHNIDCSATVRFSWLRLYFL